ncbi:MAG: hypothetical protein ABFQ64_00120 [Campylobacterota bacterium]
MKYSVQLLFTFTLFLFISGCTINIKNIELYSEQNISKTAKIALLPFTGDTHIRRASTEWFAYKLKDKIEQTLFLPAMVEITLKREMMFLTSREYLTLINNVGSNYIVPSSQKKELIGTENTYQVETFSIEDLTKIGKKLDVDYIMTGYIIIRRIGPSKYGIIEILIFDVHNQSILATIQQTGFPTLEQTGGASLGDQHYIAKITVENIIPSVKSVLKAQTKYKENYNGKK